MTHGQGPSRVPARRGRLSAMALAIAAVACAISAMEARTAAAAPAAAAGRLIVGFDPAAAPRQEAAALDAAGVTPVRRLPGAGAALVRLDAGVTRTSAERGLDRSPAVAFAEPDYRVTATAVTNDPLFASQWALQNLGASGGVPGADIDAPGAWALSTGAGVIVATTDTGADLAHPDLAANLWTNPGEIAGNGLDDDRDGWIDDVHGIDAANGDGSPADDNGHGTHVAGTIAAAAGNGVGVAGVAPGARVMPLKFMDSGGSGYTSAAITAIAYAQAHGAQVINASWGGGGYSEALRRAILQAGQAGIVFVAAAGNDGANTDASPDYPADYDLPSVISVAASDRNDALAPFSNRGACSVDLAAPGVGILSTVPGGYATYSGTSMAAPHVAGTAALMLARAPGQAPADVRARIVSSAKRRPAFAGVTVAGGRLDARAAVAAASAPAPALPGCGSAAPPPGTGLAAVSPPSVSGRPVQGQVLQAVPAAWSRPDVSLSRSWLRCDESGDWCEAIPGASGAAYRLTATDVGATIRVKEVATAGSQQAQAVSAASPFVTAAPGTSGPALSFTARPVQRALQAGGIAARAGCPAACRVTVGVRIDIFTAAGRRLRARSSRAGRLVSARQVRDLRIPCTAAQRRAALAALAARRVVRATLTATATDAAGRRGAPQVRTVRIVG